MQLTADQILKMTGAQARQIAKGSDDPRRTFARLAAQWHPDVCDHPRARQVFIHIIALRDAIAPAKPATGGFETVFMTGDGRSLRVRPYRSHPVDQGTLLVNANTIATHFPAACVDLADRESQAIQSFRFADAAMRDQMAPFLPRHMRDIPLKDGGRLVVVHREPDEILLSDLLSAQGPMPGVHAAWLCSGLLNIAAWMQYAGLAHGAIAPETVLIDPALHTVRLVAGWGFSVPAGQRPRALPGRTVDLLPRLARRGQPLDSAADLELVRQTVRDALREPRGSGPAISALPAPVSAWLMLPPARDAIGDYGAWQNALKSAWGGRKFVEFPVHASSIYR